MRTMTRWFRFSRSTPTCFFLPTITIIITLIFLTLTLSPSSTVQTRKLQVPRETVRGNKQLNNVISVAILNSINSGDFSTVGPPPASKPSAPASCSRELYDVNVMEPDTFVGALSRVHNSSTLRIGVSTVNPDRFYQNETTGEYAGYLAEVGWIVTNQMGFILGRTIRPQFVHYTFDSFFSDTIRLLNNDSMVDVVMDVAFVSTRVPYADFTCPYSATYAFAAYRNAFYALPTNVPTPSSIIDLDRPEVRVAVIRNTVYEDAVDKFLPQATKVYATTEFGMFDLLGEDADIVVNQYDLILEYNTMHNGTLALLNGTEFNFVGGNAFLTQKN